MSIGYSAARRLELWYVSLLRLSGNMTITIDPKLEARIREKAEAEGITVDAYVEHLVSADQDAEEELESLLLQGIDSGEPVEVGPGYWEEKHRQLDERLRRTGTH